MATKLLRVEEVLLPDHARNGGAPTMRRASTRAAWWLLYAVFPLTLLLFELADLVPETSGWRPVTESIAVLLIFGGVAAWVHRNRLALSRSTEGAGDGIPGVSPLAVQNSPKDLPTDFA